MLKILENKLLTLAKKYKNMVVLNADFSNSLGLKEFSRIFGERHFNFGLAENNAVAASAGFVVRGKIPVIVGFGNFLAGRSWEVIRDAICVNNLNVKLIGIGGATGDGEGAAFQSFEDISLMRVLPNMKVAVPSDSVELESALVVAMETFGPVYLRICVEDLPDVFESGISFEFGKAKEFFEVEEKYDLVVFSAGKMFGRAVSVANRLRAEGKSVQVLNVSSIKPLDTKKIKELAGKAERCLSLEDHSVFGGIGSALAEAGVQKLKIIGVPDIFGRSGNLADWERKFGLDEESVFAAAKEF